MSDPTQELILVDRHDTIVGFSEKMQAHQNGGRLHRAFSVLVFNTQDEMLLQLRSLKKYHFGGLWTNACCGHPTRGVEVSIAASRRLQEEFGFTTGLEKRFSFIYESHDSVSGLSEHELDHVFVGRFDGEPSPNADEIDAFRWVPIDDLLADLRANPQQYTPWFRILMSNPRAIEI